MSKYVIALYIRLSIEDIKVESMSIDSQKALLHKYAEGLAEDTEIIEYVDNGHTGLNFERPAVQELLNDVQHHKINCIIVKDFSRFGRNSIEVGHFTQQVFPLYNIRFISVADCYDSNEHKGDTGGIEVSVKYLVNEFYSRDLSMKTRTAKYAKMRRGEYKANNYPYGYIPNENKDPVIDESVADIVRMIFELTIEGKSAPYIAKVLYDMNIPTPAQYRTSRGKKGYNTSNVKHWDPEQIRRMIQNETYMGMFVMCKQKVQDVGSNIMINRDKSEWIMIPNHHPAIVTEEVFRKANEIKLTFKQGKHKTRIYPLRAKVICGCCNHSMDYIRRKAPGFDCKYTLLDSSEPCYKLSITADDLHKQIFDMILQHTQKIIDNADVIENNTEQLTMLDRYISECQREKQRLYERLVSEEISIDEFKTLKEKCNAEIQSYEQQKLISIKSAEKSKSEYTSKTRLLKMLKDVQKETTLTQALSDALVEKVFVYPDKSIKVKWKVEEFETQMPS